MYLLQRASIKLVPRIDLAALAARKPEDARANFGKQPKVRPPARPFNPDEVRLLCGSHCCVMMRDTQCGPHPSQAG